MVRELQKSFREILNDDIDWIDDETKKLAEEKLNSMSLKIGYPDFILTRHKLDEKFATLHIHPDKYFENTLNVLKYLNNEEQKKVSMAVNKTIWQTYPAVVNAFYSRSKNQIMFPAGDRNFDRNDRKIRRLTTDALLANLQGFSNRRSITAISRRA